MLVGDIRQRSSKRHFLVGCVQWCIREVRTQLKGRCWRKAGHRGGCKLEVRIRASRSGQKVKVKSFRCVRLFLTPWTVACQAPPSMGSSRQEYWSELPFPSPEDLPNPGLKSGSPTLQGDSLPSELLGKAQLRATGKTTKAQAAQATLQSLPQAERLFPASPETEISDSLILPVRA